MKQAQNNCIKFAFLLSLVFFELFGFSQSRDKKDSLELFFGSKGVVSLNISNILKKQKSILLYNNDNTVYATLDLFSNKIKINKIVFNLNDFETDKSKRNAFFFFPKEFYPELSIIQFEYSEITKGYIEIFVNKKKGIKKKLKSSDFYLIVETWKEHLQGRMIGFNPKLNKIKKENKDYSESLGFENSKEDYIFIVREIKGDWMRIECADICEIYCNLGTKYNGWIKWKTGKQLLVDFLYSC